MTTAATKNNRAAELKKAEMIWVNYVRSNPDIYRIGEVKDAVTAHLAGVYKQVRRRFLDGDEAVELRDVYEAFNNYAKAHRLPNRNRQLGGELVDTPQRRPPQVIHREFRLSEQDSNRLTIRREIRSTVTEQVEMQPDQIERAVRYFGYRNKEEYVERQVIKRI